MTSRGGGGDGGLGLGDGGDTVLQLLCAKTDFLFDNMVFVKDA